MLYPKAGLADDLADQDGDDEEEEEGTVSATVEEEGKEAGSSRAPVSCAESSATKQGAPAAKKAKNVCYMAPFAMCTFICTAV